jgi:hypothetical protein
MKKIFLILALVLNYTLSNALQDYTIYNNLSTTAKKYFVAKRYVEADYIFNSINTDYFEFYKSIDLYFWASTLVYLNRKEEAFEKIIIAQKRQNDCWGIEYKVKNDSLFKFLTKEQFLEISNIQAEINNTEENSILYDSIIQIHAYDSYIRDYITDSLVTYEKGTPERERIQKHINNMNREVSQRFYLLVSEYGFPNGCYLMGLCELFLAHLDSDYWIKFEPILRYNLKIGKISPFTYAYTYFRTHHLEDKYGSLYYPEFGARGDLLIKRNNFAERGIIGVGI